MMWSVERRIRSSLEGQPGFLRAGRQKKAMVAESLDVTRRSEPGRPVGGLSRVGLPRDVERGHSTTVAKRYKRRQEPAKEVPQDGLVHRAAASAISGGKVCRSTVQDTRGRVYLTNDGL